MFDRLPMRQIKIDLCPTFDPTSVSIHLKRANRGHSYSHDVVLLILKQNGKYVPMLFIHFCFNIQHHHSRYFHLTGSYLLSLAPGSKIFLQTHKVKLALHLPPPCHVCVMWFCWLHLLVTSSWGNLWPSVKQLQWKLALQTLRPLFSARKWWTAHCGSGTNFNPFKYLRILFMRRQRNGRSSEGSMQCQQWCGHCWR